jgi:hypothetical protein
MLVYAQIATPKQPHPIASYTPILMVLLNRIHGITYLLLESLIFLLKIRALILVLLCINVHDFVRLLQLYMS